MILLVTANDCVVGADPSEGIALADLREATLAAVHLADVVLFIRGDSPEALVLKDRRSHGSSVGTHVRLSDVLQA